MDAIYEVHGLTKRYGRTAALNGVVLPSRRASSLACLAPTAAAKQRL